MIKIKEETVITPILCYDEIFEKPKLLHIFYDFIINTG